ncbi:hypothetical protein ACH5RR_018375, partial [Cinchona calisaya]
MISLGDECISIFIEFLRIHDRNELFKLNILNFFIFFFLSFFHVSHLSNTTNPNPHKRPSPLNTTSSSVTTSAHGGAAPQQSLFPLMRKAKSPAVAYSLDNKKNGQPPHIHFSRDINTNHTSMIDVEEEDPSILSSNVVMDPSISNFNSNAVSGGASSGTANLSRKKATPPQPQKKLVIKLLKGKPTLPSNFEEATWATLKSAINAIFLKQPDPCDLEKLYQAVNDLCLHKMGGNLYQQIEKECEAHISAALQSLVGQSEDLVVFLSLVEKCWQDFCGQMLMIRGIALYLDRTYVKQTPNVRSLWDMGLQLFRKHLCLAPEVEHKTVFGLLKMIESERLGEAVDRTLLYHLLKMFTALGIYSESFEKPFLERTSEFYAAEGVKYMQQSDVPDYLKHVEIRLHEEHERCLLYLDSSTRKPLVATAERRLLECHIVAILDKGFTMLMDGHRNEDLQRVYTLFFRVNAFESLRQALSSYIRRTGQDIVMDDEKDKDMVSSLLELKSSLDRTWEESFSKNEAFSNTIKDAFEHLINLRQ